MVRVSKFKDPYTDLEYTYNTISFSELEDKDINNFPSGKYKGRKPVAVDEAKFRAVCARWRTGEITATAAMQEVGLKANTFYRRVKDMNL